MRNPKFDQALEWMKQVHDTKNQDYAEDQNPYSNFEFAATFAGVTVEQVFDVMIGIKQARLRVLTQSGRVPNHEAIQDTRGDQSVYATLKFSYFGRGAGSVKPAESSGQASQTASLPTSAGESWLELAETNGRIEEYR